MQHFEESGQITSDRQNKAREDSFTIEVLSRLLDILILILEKRHTQFFCIYKLSFFRYVEGESPIFRLKNLEKS